jgi:hypothetical protein
MSAIRGPGIQLPFGSPQINGAGGEIVLPSGGIYVVPQGNYICQLGSQTVAQWFDPNNGLWRVVQPSGDLMQISADGGNYRLVNVSGTCVGANITNAGSGGVNGIGPVQTGSTVTFGAPAAGGVTATATGYVIVGGSVQAPVVTQGGSGFLVPPAVFCDPPPAGGVQATAVATISAAGVITAITMVNVGAGYTSSPQWYIAPQGFNGFLATPDRAAGAFPPPGLINPANVWPGSVLQPNIAATGALLTPAALTGSGTLTAIVMTYYGAGYTGSTVPTISFGGTSLGAAAATAIMSFCANAATITGASGTAYVVGAPVISTLGFVAGSNNNNTFVPRPIRGKVTNATGPAFTVEDPGFGIQSAGTGVTLGGAGFTALGNVPAANLGGINDTSILQQATQ